MEVEQRFFHHQAVFLCLFASVWIWNSPAEAADKTVIIGDGKIAFTLPSGWVETDLNAEKVLGGYATQDNRSSVFFRPIDAGNGSMHTLLELTIANFDQDDRFFIGKVEKFNTGQVDGIEDGAEKQWPAIYTTAEGKVNKDGEEFPMKFYLLVFDTGTRVYFMQASSTMPVRESRERQIIELMRSIVAKP